MYLYTVVNAIIINGVPGEEEDVTQVRQSLFCHLPIPVVRTEALINNNPGYPLIGKIKQLLLT